MKNLIFILFVFVTFNSFGQENTALYLQGYRVGANLAKECDNPNRYQIYSNTINAGYDIDYTNGVVEGWTANLNYCSTAIDPVSTTNPGHTWYCSFLGIFCNNTDDGEE